MSRCGKGWRADSPVDMGGYTGADRCCRHHDLGCPLRWLTYALVVVVDRVRMICVFFKLSCSHGSLESICSSASIEPSETKWGLTNVRPHTVMHCSCDERSTFNWILTNKLVSYSAGSAIAWSLCGPRRRTLWATCSSTWSTSPASSSRRRRCARRGTGGGGAPSRRRNLLQSGKSRCLIGTGVYEAHYDDKVCDRLEYKV